MIAEAITIDGSVVMSTLTLVAIVMAAIKLAITGTSFSARLDAIQKDVKHAMARQAVLEQNVANHHTDDNVKHHYIDLEIVAMKNALGIPTAPVHHDVTPIRELRRDTGPHRKPDESK